MWRAFTCSACARPWTHCWRANPCRRWRPRRSAAPSSAFTRCPKMRKFAIALALCLPLFATGPLVSVDEAGFQKLVNSHKGKVAVYDFWATWCAPCRDELPELGKLEARLRSQGVEVITISADEPEQKAAAEKFIQKFGVQGPAYLKQ